MVTKAKVTTIGIEEAARHAGCHRNTIYRAIKAGHLSANKVGLSKSRGGEKWEIAMGDFLVWLQRMSVPFRKSR